MEEEIPLTKSVRHNISRNPNISKNKYQLRMGDFLHDHLILKAKYK